MDAILAGTSTLSKLVGDVFTLMTANPLLTLFLAASLIGLGLTLFRIYVAVKGVYTYAGP